MNINIVVLTGRLTVDPELRTTTTGKSVCSFQIAVNEGNTTHFLTVVTWEKTAEFVSKYFSKGKPIALNGRIQTRSYTDKNGQKRTAFEILASNVEFVESRQAEPAKEPEPEPELEDDLPF